MDSSIRDQSRDVMLKTESWKWNAHRTEVWCRQIGSLRDWRVV
jgi:hypothetical protein